MKINNTLHLVLFLLLISCGGKNENNTPKNKENETPTETAIAEKEITEKDLKFENVI
jgi:hypothetical protein